MKPTGPKKLLNPWRPKLGEAVLYYDGHGAWRRGTVHSYEGHELIAVDLACGIARARFQLKELRHPSFRLKNIET